MHKIKKNSLEGPHENVFAGPAVALDGPVQNVLGRLLFDVQPRL